MTDDAQNDTQPAKETAKEIPAAVAASADDPMEKAKANGYKEEPAPSHDERVNALIADVEHAMAHNAPMTAALLAEMKALLKG